MFKKAGTPFRVSQLRRLHTASRKFGRHTPSGVLLATTVVTGAILWHTATRNVIHNDAPTTEGSKLYSYNQFANTAQLRNSGKLNTLVWGSNRSHLLEPGKPDSEVIRMPATASWLEDVALRDLVFHQKHAACVDARGDVYQWGDDFFGAGNHQKPKLTLRGKNITSLRLTDSKVFALSASGRIYVLSAESAKQALPTGVPTPATTPWWSTGWLWGEEQAVVDFAELISNNNLAWGEKFVSIDAGDNHLLALTSKGRTFSHPVNKKANSSGQLGLRKIDLPDPSSPLPKATRRLSIELIPSAVCDPYAKHSSLARSGHQPNGIEDTLSSIDDESIRFCDKLFEIPSLRGIEIAQIVAGARSSHVRTPSGKVLGWGANEFGQIGLGSDMTLDMISVPTEVNLWCMVPRKTRTRCLDVASGGNLTSFVVERADDSSPTSVDVLMCGNGQWGGLGNNQYSNAQGTPLRARNISGLLEYSDKLKCTQPITPQAISISSSGHVLLTLDTDTADTGGRDLVVWGKNHDSELGNGKKGSSPIPFTLNGVDGERFMLMSGQANQVKDLQGRVWKKGVKVEQKAVAGPGNSTVYWKIVE